MYYSVKAAVRSNNETSPFLDSNIGVKQGDPSFSLLVLLFINDILTICYDNIEGLFTQDDLKVFILLLTDAVFFAHTPEALQSLPNDLQYYCTTWKLEVNTNKTKIMIFENG